MYNLMANQIKADIPILFTMGIITDGIMVGELYHSLLFYLAHNFLSGTLVSVQPNGSMNLFFIFIASGTVYKTVLKKKNALTC